MFDFAPSAPFSDLFVPSLAPSEFPLLPQSSSSIFNLNDFSMAPFNNLSDFTFFGDPDYNFDFDFPSFGSNPANTFGTEFLDVSGSNFDSSAFIGFRDLHPALALAAWGSESQTAFTPRQELPLLPPPPASSPPYTEPDAFPVEDSVASTPIATKDIDLAFSEKNIIHGKRPRTLSSCAAAAPAPKKPRSR
jgi:hypothetical protein